MLNVPNVLNARRLTMAAVIAAAMALPAFSAAPVQAADEGPTLEAVSPTGPISVHDKECFPVTVKGRGFQPRQTGEKTWRSVVMLKTGSSLAMGGLRDDVVFVQPDEKGEFTKTFKPCGITTHVGGKGVSEHRCEKTDHADVMSPYHRMCQHRFEGEIVRFNVPPRYTERVIVQAQQGVPQSPPEEKHCNPYNSSQCSTSAPDLKRDALYNWLKAQRPPVKPWSELHKPFPTNQAEADAYHAEKAAYEAKANAHPTTKGYEQDVRMHAPYAWPTAWAEASWPYAKPVPKDAQ